MNSGSNRRFWRQKRRPGGEQFLRFRVIHGDRLVQHDVFPLFQSLQRIDGMFRRTAGNGNQFHFRIGDEIAVLPVTMDVRTEPVPHRLGSFGIHVADRRDRKHIIEFLQFRRMHCPTRAAESYDADFDPIFLHVLNPFFYG